MTTINKNLQRPISFRTIVKTLHHNEYFCISSLGNRSIHPPVTPDTASPTNGRRNPPQGREVYTTDVDYNVFFDAANHVENERSSFPGFYSGVALEGTGRCCGRQHRGRRCDIFSREPSIKLKRGWEDNNE